MTGSTPFDAGIEQARREAAAGSVNAMDDLASGLRERFYHAGDPADLDEAIAVLRMALELLPPANPARPVLLSNLASILRDSFQLYGEATALRESLACADAALAALPVDTGDHALASMNRAETLRLLTEHTGDPEPLAAAVATARRIAAGLPEAQPLAVQVWESLGGMMLQRYLVANDPAALTEAVDWLRRCVRATPDGDPRLHARLNGLGNALRQSALRTGDEGTREAAIRHLRAALAGLPPASVDRHAWMTDLAIALCDRGRHTGDLAALLEGVHLLRVALDATDQRRYGWGNRCETYLLAVHSLIERTGEPAALDEAIRIGRSARGRGGEKATIPILLGLLLQVRFDRSRNGEDLAGAIAALNEAAALAPYGDADHVAVLGNLGQAWLSTFEADGDPEALRRAVTMLARAVRASPPGLPLRGQCLSAYGNALLARYEIRSDPAILRAAGAAYREAAEVEGSAPVHRVLAARAWGGVEARIGRWRQARAGYDLAVRLLPLVAPRRLARTDQQHGLTRLGGLAADAAACALQAGDPGGAVRLLELARGILLTQGFDGRSDLSRLSRRHPDLAARIAHILDRLAPSGYQTGSAADERHGLDLELQDLLGQARALPGFAGFLAPPTLRELLDCAVDGPVALVNVSRHRSDALIVEPAGVTVVPVPALTPAAVAGQTARFSAALAAIQPGEGERHAQAVVAGVLGWLWDTIAGPVLDRLGHTTRPGGDWPRIWWSPVGPLALLPLHAAGHHDRRSAVSPPTVIDRVISSYTPTLRALRHARSRRATARATENLLVVAMRDTPGESRLRGAEREAAALAALTPTTVLTGAEATFESVRDALLTHPSVHFACHGLADPDDPSAGRLLLHDHRSRPLSVLEISRLDLSGARLAVLSACETSLGPRHLPDEALHLASAFQVAGYPQVVGTLWRVNDRVAGDIAVDLHRTLGRSDDVAAALHAVVHRCRDAYPHTPTLWAAHLHSGC